MVWCPVLDPLGKIVALLRAERKLAADMPVAAPQGTGRPARGHAHAQAQAQARGLGSTMYPGVEDLVISRERRRRCTRCVGRHPGQYARIMALSEARKASTRLAEP